MTMDAAVPPTVADPIVRCRSGCGRRLWPSEVADGVCAPCRQDEREGTAWRS
jgi:hypothetical protein